MIGVEKEDTKFCEQCGVGFVDSQIRRYQTRYINTCMYSDSCVIFKRLTSYIVNLLDKPLNELESLCLSCM